MPTHIIQAGDTLVALSEAHGLFAQTIWDHPDNTALRAQRKRQDALAPGDAVYIPDRSDRTELIDTDRRHRFVRKGIPAKLRVQFQIDGQPCAHQPFRLEVAAQTISSLTDGNGLVEAYVPASAREALLYLGEGSPPPMRLLLGGMEPDNTTTGMRKRLSNLGIRAPEDDDFSSPAWQRAIYQFQRMKNLKPTMKLDDATKQALIDHHDRIGQATRQASA